MKAGRSSSASAAPTATTVSDGKLPPESPTNSGTALLCAYARTPVDVLDWLEGIASLEICDAVSGDSSVGVVYCWTWPAPELELAGFQTSHDLSLPAVLALAESLGRLPPQVRIWGVGIEVGGMHQSLSPAATTAVPNAVDRICEALRRA